MTKQHSSQLSSALQDGNTPQDLAGVEGHGDVVLYFQRTETEDGLSFHQACKRGDLAEVRNLLARDPELHKFKGKVGDVRGETWLTACCVHLFAYFKRPWHTSLSSL